MNAIDFTPDWYRAQHLRKRETVIRVIMLAVLAVELLLGSLGTFAQKAAAQQRVNTLQETLTAQTETLEELGRLQVELDALREQEQLLGDVTGGAPVHRVLAELSGMLPEAALLTAVHFDQKRRVGDAKLAIDGGSGSAAIMQDDGKGHLEITGWASSDANVGTFMTNVAASVLFRDVRLLYSRPLVLRGRTGRAFKLTCTFPQYG